MRKKNQSTQFIKTCLSLSLLTLMKDQSINDITVSQICEKAGFGRTTYYRHFSNNKEELVLYISSLKWEQYKQEHEEDVKKDEGKELMKHIYNHRDFFLLLDQQNLTGLMYKIFDTIFGRKENEDPILSYGKSIFVGMYFGVVYEWIKQGCIETPEEVQKKIEQGFAYAIANLKK